MLTAIVAADRRMAIGRNGDMPWRLSDDMRHFRETTMGHTVIMGRNTWNSLWTKPLKGRRNIVVSTSMEKGEGYEVARTPEEAVRMAAKEGEAFIIGGAHIYNVFFPLTGRLIVTHVDTEAEAPDCFFPTIDPEVWKITNRSGVKHDQKADLDYEIITYERR